MKILLTGGAGFIGSHVAEKYLSKGYEVIVIDDLSTGKRENLPNGVKFHLVDITEKEKLERIFKAEKPEIVNHHAAQMSVQRSIREPKFDASVNIMGSINLLELSVKYGVRKFIYISSGGAIYGEPFYIPCDEEHPVKPLSPYGITKYVVEHYLYYFYKNYGLDYVILRYPNVYGPRQDPYGEAGVVAIFISRMLKGNDVIINGDGNQERDFVYIDDIVEANLLSLKFSNEGEGRIDPVFNLGTGKGTTVNELFLKIAGITGYKKKPLHGPPRKGEVYKISLDAKKASKFLKWQAKIDLDEGLKRTVSWFKSFS